MQLLFLTCCKFFPFLWCNFLGSFPSQPPPPSHKEIKYHNPYYGIFRVLGAIDTHYPGGGGREGGGGGMGMSPNFHYFCGKMHKIHPHSARKFFACCCRKCQLKRNCQFEGRYFPCRFFLSRVFFQDAGQLSRAGNWRKCLLNIW